MAIRLQGVSKRYLFERPQLRLPLSGRRREEAPGLTAVDSVTLDIPAGQAVGLIGRNGSGKSTLLRLIAGITWPDAGEVRVEGRLSAVLDVQSGLHPRLDGRRNIRLKGALHGLDDKQTRARMDDIIAFAGLEEFIDLPIRRYSTGMVVRLGFSVAMHMDFDVLLMDEVLSVGDVVFQRRCLAKVREFLRRGKTVVLASHNLGDVAAVCGRTVLMRQGRVVLDEGTEQVLKAYLEGAEKEQNRIPRQALPLEAENPYGSDTGQIVIEEVSFLDGGGRRAETFRTGEPMSVAIRFRCREPVADPLFRVQFFRSDGLWVHGANTARGDFSTGVLAGEGEIVLAYERMNLLEGDYLVTVGAWPDEYRSAFTDIAHDCRKCSYVVRIRSSRGDGAGIVSNPFSWRLVRGKAGGPPCGPGPA